MFALAALLILRLVDAQCQAPVSWPLPWEWPHAHHHTEIEFDAEAGGYQVREEWCRVQARLPNA